MVEVVCFDIQKNLTAKEAVERNTFNQMEIAPTRHSILLRLNFVKLRCSYNQS
jgi:hypothetical protein